VSISELKSSRFDPSTALRTLNASQPDPSTTRLRPSAAIASATRVPARPALKAFLVIPDEDDQCNGNVEPGKTISADAAHGLRQMGLYCFGR
jgi:hypothetical protein